MKTNILFVALSVVVLTSCVQKEEVVMVNPPGIGMFALEWGSSPEAARDHMMEIEGVVFQKDTILSGIDHSYTVPDTVEADTHPQTLRWDRFVGGALFGVPVETWTLSYEHGTSLVMVYILFDSGEDPHRQHMTVVDSLRRLTRNSWGWGQDVWFTMNRWGDTGADTTMVGRVRVESFLQGRDTEQLAAIFFTTDIRRAAWRARYGPRRTMHVSEFEAEKRRIERETGKTLVGPLNIESAW